jgi:hypothetical protein
MFARRGVLVAPLSAFVGWPRAPAASNTQGAAAGVGNANSSFPAVTFTL